MAKKVKTGVLKPDATPTTTTTQAPTGTSAHVGRPTGTIPTTLKIAYGRGGPWSKVTQDAPLHEKYGNPYSIADVMMAVEAIESGGEMIWNRGGSGAFGTFQIKEEDWGWLAKELGVSLQTREGQAAVAAGILGKYGKGKDWKERFLESYYPVRDKTGKICLTCKGEDGATPQQYLDDIETLRKIINAAGKDIVPVEPVEPIGDVIDLLFGGKGYVISAYFGQPITWRCDGCYTYQLSYGLDTAHHYAYDVAANAGDGAPLYAPIDGMVVCAGTGVGSGAWGTGCGAFPRDNNYGSPYPNGVGQGRIEILNEAGTASIIIGHALSASVRAGQRVKRGDLIGKQGGMNASHVHLEGRTSDGRMVDVRKVFGGGPIVVEAERIPYDLVNDPTLFTVKALKDVKVYQRGNPNAMVIDSIPKGDTFQAKAIIPGTDGKQWWLGARDGRVPMEGTELVR